MLPLLLMPLIIAVAGTTATRRTLENTCPEALVFSDRYLLQLKNDYCYRFVINTRKDYSDANRDCQKHGGTLALPKDEHINDYLASKTLHYYGTKDPVWIGLHDKKKEKKFIWEDHEKLGNWNKFAKDNGIKNKGADAKYEDCVALHPTDTMWHDYHCHKGFVAFWSGKDTRKRYICQYTTTLPVENPTFLDIYNKPPTPPNQAGRSDVAPNRDDSGIVADDNSGGATGDFGVTDGESDMKIEDPDFNATLDDSGMAIGYSNTAVDDPGVAVDSDVTSNDSDVTADDSDVTADDSDVTDDNSDVTTDDSDVTSDDGTDVTEDIFSDDTSVNKDEDECPAFSCDTDCGFYGYKTGDYGCPLCQCGNM